jgi:hypothetical protein
MLQRSLIFLKVTRKQMIGECKSRCTIVESAGWVKRVTGRRSTLSSIRSQLVVYLVHLVIHCYRLILLEAISIVILHVYLVREKLSPSTFVSSVFSLSRDSVACRHQNKLHPLYIAFRLRILIAHFYIRWPNSGTALPTIQPPPDEGR